VWACTVCGSDIKIFRHGNKRLALPRIVGHEIAGEIVAAGEGVEAVRVGDRVAIGADIPGVWNTNVPGKTDYVDYATGHEFDGGFAQYMLLNADMLKFGPVAHIPDSLPYEHAALAEPLACAIKGLELANFGPGKSICVIGLGPIGCMILELAQAYGAAAVFAAQRSRTRLELARAVRSDVRFIATEEENLVETVLRETRGLGVDLAITTAGSVRAHEDAIEVVGHRGYVNFFGGLRGEPELCIDSNKIHYKECFVMGSHGSAPDHHKRAVQMLAGGYVHGDRYISQRFPLAQIAEAYAYHESRAGLKAVVLPNGQPPSAGARDTGRAGSGDARG
jgi:L-iditol 2-dehydrogenase